MDPEETLRAAFRALEAGDKPAAKEFLGYYSDWRSRGGFEPKEGDARAIAMRKQLNSRKRKKKHGPVGPKVSVRHVPLNRGGYEYGKYGQYYGNVPGERLYRYEIEDREYAEVQAVDEYGELRAPSRAAAKKKIRARVPGARMRGLGGTRARARKCKYGRISRGKRKGQCRTARKKRKA